jgi:hypothetical protein
MKNNKLHKKVIITIILITVYLTADIAMDIVLFPRLTDVFKQHHSEMVANNMIVFNLVWVWLAGFIYSKSQYDKQKNRWAKFLTVFFGSALAATVIFSFTSLPFIWIASTVPLLASISLFLHDYGIIIYFIIMMLIFSYKYYRNDSV